MNLYESMHQHPELKPVFDLLELVEPVDEFSQAVTLVRDCFSTNNTLRTLCRRALRRMVSERTNLMTAYEAAVVQAAKDAGHSPANFGEALAALPGDVATQLRDTYRAQVDAVMGRPLKR